MQYDTKKDRLKIYQKMLRDYRIARIFNFLTCGSLDIKELYDVEQGFCNYIIHNKKYNDRINLNILVELNKLRPRETYQNSSIWFKPGSLLPRIELLKKAISDTKMHIEIERLMLEK